MTEPNLWKPRSQPNATLAAALGGRYEDGVCIIPGENGSLTLTPVQKNDRQIWRGQFDTVHFQVRFGDTYRDQWAEALADRFGDHRWWFEVQTSYLGPLGLHIIHKRHGPDKPTTDISNPIVEKMASVVGGESNHLTNIFQEGPFVESLMAIVHQHPGSEVTATRVILRVPGKTINHFSRRVKEMVIVAQRLEQLGKRMRQDAAVES